MSINDASFLGRQHVQCLEAQWTMLIGRRMWEQTAHRPFMTAQHHNPHVGHGWIQIEPCFGTPTIPVYCAEESERVVRCHVVVMPGRQPSQETTNNKSVTTLSTIGMGKSQLWILQARDVHRLQNQGCAYCEFMIARGARRRCENRCCGRGTIIAAQRKSWRDLGASPTDPSTQTPLPDARASHAQLGPCVV